jgi:16S rRNA (uracil1498-N3)-methyltransferase
MHRFYIPDIDATERSISLDGVVARQLRTVLRVQSGEHIRLFDGAGSEWEVEVDDVGKSGISTTLISAVEPVPEADAEVTMLLGLARPERIELAIQKCTELGAVRFVPVMSERVQGGNTGSPSEKRLERWRRIAIEAAEQSGRAVVPTVEAPIPVLDAIASELESQTVLCMWEEVGDESISLSTVLKQLAGKTSRVAALIGPPGGFSDQEASAIRDAGASLVTLGPRVLRSETAAIAVMSAILYELGDLGGQIGGC